MNYDEITITKYETEFVAKHKDYDVIGVGGNEFEAVLELSKALGALMFSKDIKAKKEHELLGLYKTLYKTLTFNACDIDDIQERIKYINNRSKNRAKIQIEITTLEKELGEMK